MKNDITPEILLIAEKFLNLESLPFDEFLLLINSVITSKDNNPLYIYMVWFNNIVDTAKIEAKRTKKPLECKYSTNKDGYCIDGKRISDKAIHDYFHGMVTEVINEVLEEDEYTTYYRIVMHHIKSDRYMMIDGSYDSYDGMQYKYSKWVECERFEVVTHEYKIIE